MINFLKYNTKLFINKIKWKHNNRHNKTWIVNVFDIKNVKVGKYTYGPINVFNDTSNRLSIGSFCSIATDTRFIVGGEHNFNRISSFPFKHYFCDVKYEANSKGDILIGDDVWIGQGAIILSGVTIGNGAVIGAGSVVTKNVPPYSIVGGNPAKIIRSRFDEDLINELMRIDYSKLTKKDICSHINELYDELYDIRKLNWLPKK